MEFSTTKEQEQIKQEIISFSKKWLNKDEDMDHFSNEMWKKTAEFGLFGLNISEEYGGMEESFLTSAIAIEALGYGCKNNGFVFVVNNHIWVGLNLINIYGTKSLRKKYIKRMVEGDLIGAIGITEADAGSDAHAMRTDAVETDSGYVLNGSKMFVSNGTIADVFIVFAKIDVKANSLITAFVVERKFVGVIVGQEIEKMGLGSCPMAEVTFKDCVVPKENILGIVGRGDVVLKGALEWERCYEFGCHIGAMQRIMEKCLVYINERKQFGKYINEFQSITHKIADMKMKIELSRLLLYKIAWQKDNDKNAYLDTSIFKLFVSESYIQTCKEAMQIFGAYGYTKEYEIEREMRDALACSIYSGTSEIQRNTIYTISTMDILS